MQADTWRVRLGLEASRRFALGEGEAAGGTETGVQERGVSLTARLTPGWDGQGLSVAVTPRWGARTGGAEALWRDEMPAATGSAGADTASVEASIGYGFASPRGVLTPFAEGGLRHGESRVRVGTRFKAFPVPLAVEIFGERRGRAGSDPEHGVNFEVTFSY